MIRSALATLTALALGLGSASADEWKGTLKSVNKGSNSLTLTVDGKDKTLAVGKDASFVTVSSEKGKKGKVMEKVTPLEGGLGALKTGSAVTVLTEKTETKETVTSVKVSAGEQAADKKKKKKPANADKAKKKADKKAKKAKKAK